MANKIGLKTLNGIQIVLLDTNPATDGTGFDAPVGSQAYLVEGGVGKAFLKKGSGATAWKKIADQDDIDGINLDGQWSLGGNALTQVESFGSSSGDFDISVIRNSSEFLRLSSGIISSGGQNLLTQDLVTLSDSVLVFRDSVGTDQGLLAYDENVNTVALDAFGTKSMAFRLNGTQRLGLEDGFVTFIPNSGLASGYSRIVTATGDVISEANSNYVMRGADSDFNGVKATGVNVGHMVVRAGDVAVGSSVDPSSSFFLGRSGDINEATNISNTASSFLRTGDTAGTGNTGSLELRSGNAASGNSGNVNIQSGTAGTNRGVINFSASQVNAFADVFAQGSAFVIADGTETEQGFFAHSGTSARIGSSVAIPFEVAVNQAVVATYNSSQISFANELTMNSNKIVGLLDPTAAQDAATKAYVDSIAAGLDPKESTRVATTADVGGTYSPTGGTAGTGSFSGMSNSIDGISLAVGDRILVKDQTDALQNGIYEVLTVGTGADGTWERAADHDGNPTAEVSAGNFAFVSQGTANAASGWVITGDGILTLNTDAVNWSQFSAAQALTAGDGIDITGSTISVDADPSVFAFNTGVLDVAPNGLDGSHTRLTNPEFLRARNFAGDGDFSLIGLGGTNTVTIGDPTTNIGIKMVNQFGDIANFNNSGVSLSKSLNLNNNPIFNVNDPVNAKDAANKQYVDANFAPADSSATVTTANATQTTLFSEAIAEGDHKLLKVVVNGVDQTSGESAMYIRTVHAKRLAAGNAQIVLESTDFTSEEDASWNLVIAADATAQAIDVDVVGDATNSVVWSAEVEVKTF